MIGNPESCTSSLRLHIASHLTELRLSELRYRDISCCCSRLSFIFSVMVEQFVGSWNLVSSDNFDEYMKAVGMGFATRQMGNMTKPKLVVSVGEDGVISMKAESTFKTTEIKFKLNEEFDETTVDGRNTKSIFTFENGKLMQKQMWEGKTTTLDREIQDGKLITTCFMDDVVAVRTYEKAA
ncbi:fatty acid binding protein 4b [Melanotaenia boesemani]|uniref:fatty acid binding protein 4b n=1 Tax=Melanotaenia boesemani TaxID=1250792 RepID=UPI001C04195B|nr:fatty acid binding protein 4b [Melanotaenia boesemani]